MYCANPNCRLYAGDLLDGTLWLLEMDVPPDDRITGAGGGFPVCSVRSRYFWLCAKCSKASIIKKWTPSGLILEPIPEAGAFCLQVQSAKKTVAKAGSIAGREALIRTA